MSGSILYWKSRKRHSRTRTHIQIWDLAGHGHGYGQGPGTWDLDMDLLPLGLLARASARACAPSASRSTPSSAPTLAPSHPRPHTPASLLLLVLASAGSSAPSASVSSPSFFFRWLPVSHSPFFCRSPYLSLTIIKAPSSYTWILLSLPVGLYVSHYLPNTIFFPCFKKHRQLLFYTPRSRLGSTNTCSDLDIAYRIFLKPAKGLGLRIRSRARTDISLGHCCKRPLLSDSST
ncbi:hypothetical protein B0J13DRAFT_13521 [Dactylonectria estremocensis]|uniref:Uncharacterized protein n=1 Tax=Dactylonectria estremocensis TaxID=1079267 RepID=A0A9P9FKE0_9HYPO|nr:hypothetical protein B0J13DRAFT_13521 [Dactylonectria estremocensis]